MNLKSVKKMFMVMCLLAFTALFTGCGAKVKTNVKIRSSSTADYTMSFGVDDEMLKGIASMSEVSEKELIDEMTKEGLKYSTETSKGITYHVFTMSEKKVKLSKIEDMLEEMGYTNVCLKKDYFFASYKPQSSSASTGDMDELMEEIAKETGVDASEFHCYQTISIQLRGTIKNTNGKVSKSNKKCVTWTQKNFNKARNFYASTSSTKRSATVRNIKNGKTYKIGRKGKVIKIANASSAARIRLNGKTIKNGKVIKKAGKYSLTIWSKTGRCKTITFKIKK